MFLHPEPAYATETFHRTNTMDTASAGQPFRRYWQRGGGEARSVGYGEFPPSLPQIHGGHCNGWEQGIKREKPAVDAQ